MEELLDFIHKETGINKDQIKVILDLEKMFLCAKSFAEIAKEFKG